MMEQKAMTMMMMTTILMIMVILMMMTVTMMHASCKLNYEGFVCVSFC